MEKEYLELYDKADDDTQFLVRFILALHGSRQELCSVNTTGQCTIGCPLMGAIGKCDWPRVIHRIISELRPVIVRYKGGLEELVKIYERMYERSSKTHEGLSKPPVMCDCCNRAPTSVACSSLGAFSLAYCRECINHNAEPEKYIRDTVEINNGWNGTADWVKNLTFYKDGEYRPATDIVLKDPIHD